MASGGMSQDGQGPRYMQPILSSQLPDYSNEDQDRIRNAFHPGSWQSLGTLPHNLQPGYSSSMRVDTLERQAMGLPPMRPGGKAAPYFMEFEYQASPFGLADDLKAMERMEHHDKQRVIGGEHPFLASGKSLVPPGITSFAVDGTPFEYVPEPFEAVRDEKARQKWLEQKKVVGGAFLPSIGEKSLVKPSRSMLTDIMKQLYRLVAEDWDHTQPTVFATEEDLIVVYFRTAGLRTTAGVTAYMNVLANRNETIAPFGLQKVPEGWNTMSQDSILLFTFRPPWVKPRAVNPHTLTQPTSRMVGGE